MDSGQEFKVIEMNMMRLPLFFPLASLGSISVHTLLYPLTLVRTRLQLQDRHSMYRGLFHATSSIIREEGVRGLYSGLFVKSTQLVSTAFYVGTYEGVRGRLAHSNFSRTSRSFLAGGCASLVGQTIVVPVDVVAQHLMVLNLSQSSKKSRQLTPIHLRPEYLGNYRNVWKASLSLILTLFSEKDMKTGMTRSRAIVRHIYQLYGVRGFYQGYFISLSTFVPHSGLFWAFYNTYCDLISNFLLPDSPRLMVQVMSAPLAGMTSSTLMNPVDCIRVRMQVDNTRLKATIKHVWETDGIRFVKKGLSARLLQSSLFSFWIILFYEPTKLLCLKEEYRAHYGW